MVDLVDIAYGWRAEELNVQTIRDVYELGNNVIITVKSRSYDYYYDIETEEYGNQQDLTVVFNQNGGDYSFDYIDFN